MFIIKCPHCASTLRLPDEVDGKIINCYRCLEQLLARDTEKHPEIDPLAETVNIRRPKITDKLSRDVYPTNR